jgi:hypothetical protein
MNLSPTTGRTVRQVVPGVESFGGITLNYSVGGINPIAVENMIKFTGGCGKVVWLPTHDSANHKSFFAKKPDAGGIRVIDSTGNVAPDVRKIMKMVSKADIILATSHISPKESLAVVKAAKEEGVKKMVVTHAMQSRRCLDDVKKCVEMGAFIERVPGPEMGPRLTGVDEGWRHVSMDMYAEAIKAGRGSLRDGPTWVNTESHR